MMKRSASELALQEFVNKEIGADDNEKAKDKAGEFRNDDVFGNGLNGFAFRNRVSHFLSPRSLRLPRRHQFLFNLRGKI